ncbi:MAG: efflux RND transporter periplasmic adaptor subunit [Deltaproteobacteria bacterium]|nr:efflux RND transporter periplasmic adaptor subunit [Candidatus Zymogenaceae bacterium]
MVDKKKIIIPVAVVLIAAVVVVVVLLTKNGNNKNVITGSGTIEATEVDVSPRLSGDILSINYDEGDPVAAGDLLVEIKADELLAQRMGAEAVFINAEANLRRVKSLFNAGGVSRMDYDSADTAYRSAKSHLDYIDAALANSTIYAPINGVVLTRNLEVGEVAFPGSPILTLADLSKVWIKIYVSEPVVGLIKTGGAASIGVDTWPDRTFPGVVTYISDEPEFTPKTVQTKEERTKLVFAVKIELDNPEGLLKPGMPADAEIAVNTKR